MVMFPVHQSGQNHLARHSERGKKTRQTRKRWEDNIREWAGLEFGKSQRALENRKKWRKLVARSSVVSPTILAVKGLMVMMMYVIHHLKHRTVVWKYNRQMMPLEQ